MANMVTMKLMWHAMFLHEVGDENNQGQTGSKLRGWPSGSYTT
jgi:hypothetical protein